MKKYLLLISCSLFVAQSVEALTANQQLDAMKDMFVKEFTKMDENKDGQISKDEYLSYQFENFRATVIDADGFNGTKTEEVKKEADKDVATKTDVSLTDIPPALKEMAEFDISDFEKDIDVDLDTDKQKTAEDDVPQKLTLEDVLPDDVDAEKITPANVELSVAEEESLKKALETDEVAVEATDDVSVEEVMSKDEQIASMMQTIKQTLPKKIDDMTIWTDINYNDNVITYIYTANIDISAYANNQKEALKNSIKDNACEKAYADMCHKIKPMFIDNGILLQIKYKDVQARDIGVCDFNSETCQ